MSRFINIDDKNIARCWWCKDDPLYLKYHDREWGKPVKQDRRMFEKVCLEGFQSGLSWITILRKRETFREAFEKFDIPQVANFTKRDVERLVKNAGIIRHRGKIEATINNASRAFELQDSYGSLAKFFWSFEPDRERRFDPKRAVTNESTAMSKQLKKLGWKFVGPTTCYSFMQSMGIVNDHHPQCFRWSEVDQLRDQFKRPK